MTSTLTTRALIATALGGAVAALCLTSGSPSRDATTEAGLELALPPQLGAWHGTAGEVSRAEKEILPEDTEFAKMNYRRNRGSRQEQIHCSIVLSGKDRTSIHRPEVCLVGQGWNIDSSSEQSVELRNDATLAVRRLELSRELDGQGQRAIYYYWFVGSSATTADHLDRILLTARDNIVHNRNPRWAYVSVLAGVGSNGRQELGAQTPEQTTAMLENFIARATPEFQKVFEPARLF